MEKFSQKHMELMEEFLSKVHPSAIVNKIPLKRQSKKILQLMDVDQLLMLEEFFVVSDLREERIDERLKYFGFTSKVNIFEKKAILSDLMKRRLIRIINSNNELIDYDNLEENVDSNYVYSLLSYLQEYRMSNMEYTGETEFESNNAEFPSRHADKKPLTMELHNEATFIRELSEEMLPTNIDNVAADIPNYDNKKPFIPKSYYSKEKQDKNGGYTIHDLIDDNTVILRKKKTLYLEPSKNIDYKSNEKLVFNVDKLNSDLLEIEETVDSEIYKQFNPMKFKEDVLFKNNNIPVPKSNTTFVKLRKKMKGVKLFLGTFLINELKRLILLQDETISSFDSRFIALEMVKYLTPAEVEYFYNIYVRSAEYRPVEHIPCKNVRSKKLINKKISVKRIRAQMREMIKKELEAKNSKNKTEANNSKNKNVNDNKAERTSITEHSTENIKSNKNPIEEKEMIQESFEARNMETEKINDIGEAKSEYDRTAPVELQNDKMEIEETSEIKGNGLESRNIKEDIEKNNVELRHHVNNRDSKSPKQEDN